MLNANIFLHPKCVEFVLVKGQKKTTTFHYNQIAKV